MPHVDQVLNKSGYIVYNSVTGTQKSDTLDIYIHMLNVGLCVTYVRTNTGIPCEIQSGQMLAYYIRMNT